MTLIWLSSILRLRLIDSHTLIFPQKYRKSHECILKIDKTYADLFRKDSPPADAESLVGSMERNSISKSIVLGMGWTDYGLALDINDYLIESSKNHPDKLVPFCSINPAWGEDALYELERCFNNGARGIGELHPDTQNFDITSVAEMEGIMKFCEAKQLPVLIHCSEPIGHSYPGKGQTHPSKLIHFINLSMIYEHRLYFSATSSARQLIWILNTAHLYSLSSTTSSRLQKRLGQNSNL